MLDVRLNFQKFRHSKIASKVRHFLYRYLVGMQDYPLTFRSVKDAQVLLTKTSPHLYVHVPFCKTICHHCPYNKSLFQPYLYGAYREALLKEIEQYLEKGSGRPVESLYFGGGTPSMTLDLVCDVIDLLKDHLKAAAELGVEVHPLDASRSNLQRLKEAGINRVSIGVETFNPVLLKRVGRAYTPRQAEQSIEEAVSVGFLCVDVNLIYGIPGQSVQDSIEDTKRCLELGVNHLSAYPLISFKHTPLGRRVDRNIFPHYGRRMRLLAQREVAKICLSQGFQRTSVWSFTREKQPGYSTVTRDNYRGFGAGAGSKIEGLFWFNTFSIPEYAKQEKPSPAISLQQSERFQRFHWLYWQIYRTHIDEGVYRELYQRDVRKDFGGVLRLMRFLKWVVKTEKGWKMTERGAIWSHQLQMLFSLTYIDDVWSACQKEAWPEEIILR